MIYLLGMALIAGVILFREEIRELLGFLLMAALINWLWDRPAWWGKPAAVAVGILAILAAIGLFVEKWEKGARFRRPSGQPQQQLPVQHAAEAPPVAPRVSYGIDDWFYRFEGREYGPIPKSELLYLLERGHIPPNTPVRYMDGPWQPANQVISFKTR